MTTSQSTSPVILVQAASRAWSGAPDWCMNEIDGRPVVAMTIDNAFKEFPDADVRIIAPEFDQGGRLDDIPQMFPDKKVSVFYGYDDSPLERMVASLNGTPDEDYIIRIDGLHFAWLPEHANQMLKIAVNENLDCVKMPDGFPCQLTSDIYRVSALKQACEMLEDHVNAGIYKVHPKFYMIKNSDKFKCVHYTDHPPIADEWLSRCREIAKGVYLAGRMQVGESKGFKAGDQLTFHYELAMAYIKPDYRVLDCACGPGYGARIIAEKASRVIAADLDIQTVRNASAGTYYDNITFQTADVHNLNFPDASFDVATSFETIEHVDTDPFFKELFRVIKPGGLLILSTPQNSLGHIPVNSQHLHEFSLEEITNLCSEHFEIVKITGIKQGRVVFEDDPRGQNTFIVCRKPENS